MYELNGIVYAGNPTPMKKVIYAEYRGNYMIRVAFNTGEVVDVNFTHGFDGSAFEPLKNESVLKDFEIQHGVLTWCVMEILTLRRNICLRSERSSNTR